MFVISEIYLQILQIENFGLRKLITHLHKWSTPSISQNVVSEDGTQLFCISRNSFALGYPVPRTYKSNEQAYLGWENLGKTD